LLRLEGLIVLAASVVAYQALGASWVLFAVLLLVPDVGLMGYVVSPRAGAFAYNALHTYAGPALSAMLAWSGLVDRGWAIALIWMAHIGMDRALGIGLKYPSAFRDTHLGAVGR
jgi:hypothetical protein